MQRHKNELTHGKYKMQKNPLCSVAITSDTDPTDQALYRRTIKQQEA
jgi:hypothetical protein